MKITEVRTRVVEWRGKTVPPQPHFCTNPVDLLDMPIDTMGAFRFHSWLIVEVKSDTGEVASAMPRWRRASPSNLSIFICNRS
jgi:L-rhamnonate dehydratase